VEELPPVARGLQRLKQGGHPGDQFLDHAAIMADRGNDGDEAEADGVGYALPPATRPGGHAGELARRADRCGRRPASDPDRDPVTYLTLEAHEQSRRKGVQQCS